MLAESVTLKSVVKDATVAILGEFTTFVLYTISPSFTPAFLRFVVVVSTAPELVLVPDTIKAEGIGISTLDAVMNIALEYCNNWSDILLE